MSFTFKNSNFTLFFLFVQLCYTYGACPSLNSTETLTVTCKLNNTTLENCENPMEGTEAHLTCKTFYEEVTLKSNPKRLCQAGRWDGPIPQCYLICGKKRVKESSNNEKDENELLDYPWHVGIYDGLMQFRSGGTLIAMNIVLTTAISVTIEHYMGSNHNNTIVAIKTIFVVSGKYYLGFDDSRDKFAQSSRVQKVHFPEDYKGYQTRYKSDIAILVLADPFQPSQVVQPVCLNFDSSSYDFLLQESGILTAWDSLFFKSVIIYQPGELKVVRVLYIPNSKCYSNINRIYEEYITIDKICGENLDNASTACTGNFNVGGGMFLKNKTNDRYYIIGILSRSPQLDRFHCDPNQYSLYTAVYHHRSFVETYATANIEMKDCVLPNNSQGDEYLVFLNKTQTIENEVGDPVPSRNSACPSLNSTETLMVTCKLNNTTLENCENPMEGAEAHLTCKELYEEVTLQSNPKRLCQSGRWDGPIPQCYPICGKKRVKDSSNNENDNELLDYPWHVGIYDEDQQFLSGGTLIAMNIVLTVAASVTIEHTGYNNHNRILPIKTIFVVSGKYYLGFDDSRDKFAQSSRVQKVHFPEDYKGYQSRYKSDIAILVLADPFRPSQVVQPVCLNFDSSSYDFLLQESGILTAWNYEFINGAIIHQSGELKVVRVLYIPNLKCVANSRNDINFITNDKICGENLDNASTACAADFNLGGGMFLKNKINDRYYIIGILSRSPQFNNYSCIPNGQSLYTAVYHHRNFIETYATANIEIKNCVVPNHPRGGKYLVFLNETQTLEYKVENPVPSYSKLTIICDDHNDATQYFCSKNGQWNPILRGCTHKSTSLNYTYIILIVSAVVIIGFALMALILYQFKFKQEWQKQREMKLAGLDRFHKGNLKRFNPELDIGDQAEVLPYNYNFEFPRNKLELGKQLGAGAFGIVMQADAFGIISNEEKTVVAVKTAKNTADYMQIKALTSELKIMVHLGKHLNVVNLLGACTQNITNGELLVIVEYCRFGNLYNYLLQNRENYIDQIDKVSGNIDYFFGIEDLANVAAVIDDASAPRQTESIKPIHTKDLVAWSFQVVRGMEYLASRKILHGDLAARNILLADNNIVKICDFGLAKRMYQKMNYKKQQDCPLPMKWMAVESIRDRVFSTKSDVWSFGIVLWEFFSLAQTPYPGMEADERLYYKLLDGYKMESPQYAPKEMYKIMCDCWSFNPASRPCFNELAGRVGLMLEVNVRQHYIDLNDPYFIMNTQKLNGDQPDYLEMLRQPGIPQTSIPHNDRNIPEYLCLTTTDAVMNKTIIQSLPSQSLPNEHLVKDVEV